MPDAFSVKVEGTLSVTRQLKLLGLSQQKRRRVLTKIGRAFQKQTRANVRNQRDINGKPFPPHARKRKRKMLARLVRELKMFLSGYEVTIGFKRSRSGKIAAKQQYGHTEQHSAAKQRRREQAYYDDPASKRQAQVLVKELNYRRPVKASKPGVRKARRVSQRWIMQNMTIGQAGAIISHLRNSDGSTSWKTVLPERKFFGGTLDWLRETTLQILETEVFAPLRP